MRQIITPPSPIARTDENPEIQVRRRVATTETFFNMMCRTSAESSAHALRYSVAVATFSLVSNGMPYILGHQTSAINEFISKIVAITASSCAFSFSGGVTDALVSSKYYGSTFIISSLGIFAATAYELPMRRAVLAGGYFVAYIVPNLYRFMRREAPLQEAVYTPEQQSRIEVNIASDVASANSLIGSMRYVIRSTTRNYLGRNISDAIDLIVDKCALNIFIGNIAGTRIDKPYLNRRWRAGSIVLAGSLLGSAYLVGSASKTALFWERGLRMAYELVDFKSVQYSSPFRTSLSNWLKSRLGCTRRRAKSFFTYMKEAITINRMQMADGFFLSNIPCLPIQHRQEEIGSPVVSPTASLGM